MKTNFWKKSLTALLSLSMAFSALTLPAFAAAASTPDSFANHHALSHKFPLLQPSGKRTHTPAAIYPNPVRFAR